MRPLRRFLAITCVFLTLGGLGAYAAKAPKQYVFLPDPDAEGAAMLTGSTWNSVGPDFRIELQRIDDRERRAFIEKVTGSATDPFASPPGQPPGYLTFVIQIENHGGSHLVLRSQQCWLVTDHNEHLFPISMEGLKGRYGVVGGEPGPAYERSVSAVIPNTLHLGPGESRAGLLVYRTFKPNARRYKLDLQVTTASGDVTRVTAPYRRHRVNEDGSIKP